MHILIDGKNLLYRGIFAQSNDHPFVVISTILSSYLNMFDPPKIHVFWDDHKNNLWRKELFKEYKESDCRNKSALIKEDVNQYQLICEDFWDNMNIIQYKKEKMEADDLIYSFCHLINDKIVIISNDHDMIQLCKFQNVKVFNPLKKNVTSEIEYNPITFKCLNGDISDNIQGYNGIGPVKAEILTRDNFKLQSFLDKNGTDKFILNKKLIDLSLCPHKLNNELYIIEKYSEKTKFSKENITELIYSKYKIKGLMSKYKTLISPFNLIGE